MKNWIRKFLASSIAVVIAAQIPVFAEGETAQEATTIDYSKDNEITTSFKLYSPTLTVSVPVNAAVQVNPLVNGTNGATGVDTYTVASNELTILNASVDKDADEGIPCIATVKATLQSGKGVTTDFNKGNFTATENSIKKRIALRLAQGAVGAITKPGVPPSGGTADANYSAPEFDGNDLLQFEIGGKPVYKIAAGDYKTSPKEVAITNWGSLLSVHVPKPTTTDETDGKTFTTTASKVTPGAATFAIIGEANTAADWTENDITVSLTYNLKAANATAVLDTPTIATPPEYNSSGNANSLEVVIPNVGDATVTAVAAHNNNTEIENVYGDYYFEDKATNEKGYTVAYAKGEDGKINATVTFDTGYVSFGFLSGAGDNPKDYKGKAQDFVFALSDGRFVVTKLTCS